MITFDAIEENKRTLKTPNSHYNVVCDRRTALWSIETGSGPLPMKLQGSFTTAQAAGAAIKNYLYVRDKAKSK